ALEADKWAHVALVREADAGTLTWLIDGNAANAHSGIAEAAAPVTELIFGSGRWGNFKGYLDEVRIWKRPRGK
ncbi:MAG: hypothetical protein GTO53_08865, partial [Planctomycetales bacterium]|nr:hypothetical protein [Planctomycetales bacterium]